MTKAAHSTGDSLTVSERECDHRGGDTAQAGRHGAGALAENSHPIHKRESERERMGLAWALETQSPPGPSDKQGHTS